MLPAGYVFEVPRHAADQLLQERVAHVVGTIGAQPDLVLDEGDWEQATAATPTPAPARSESHCVHIHADPSSPRCLIEGVSYCPMCAVDRICVALESSGGKAGETARTLDFRSCKHGYRDKRICLVCFNSIVGALHMMWGHIRAKTFDSTPEANRILRLLQILSDRIKPPIGSSQPMRSEKAVLHSERWEKRA